jgi:F-type H+-transporting ATPase subunit gamma
MSSVAQLKSRIKSVGSTKQITGAMQLVSASKMRRATANVKETFDYAAATREILANFASDADILASHELFAKRPVRTHMLIVISSDSGLAGAYNSNVFREFSAQLRDDDARHVQTLVLTLGRKISEFANKLTDVSVLASFAKLPDQPTGAEIRSLLQMALREFREKSVDAVDLIYTKFNSAVSQQVITERILPAGAETLAGNSLDSPASFREIKFEPSREEVLKATVERMIETEIVQALLDSRASEHSTRMMAMKNATDNANDLVDDLTLAMNKERQARITQELTELIAGSEAI